jgi:hypothetical protein
MIRIACYVFTLMVMICGSVHAQQATQGEWTTAEQWRAFAEQGGFYFGGSSEGTITHNLWGDKPVPFVSCDEYCVSKASPDYPLIFGYDDYQPPRLDSSTGYTFPEYFGCTCSGFSANATFGYHATFMTYKDDYTEVYKDVFAPNVRTELVRQDSGAAACVVTKLPTDFSWYQTAFKAEFQTLAVGVVNAPSRLSSDKFYSGSLIDPLSIDRTLRKEISLNGKVDKGSTFEIPIPAKHAAANPDLTCGALGAPLSSKPCGCPQGFIDYVYGYTKSDHFNYVGSAQEMVTVTNELGMPIFTSNYTAQDLEPFLLSYYSEHNRSAGGQPILPLTQCLRNAVVRERLPRSDPSDVPQYVDIKPFQSDVHVKAGMVEFYALFEQIEATSKRYTERLPILEQALRSTQQTTYNADQFTQRATALAGQLFLYDKMLRMYSGIKLTNQELLAQANSYLQGDALTIPLYVSTIGHRTPINVAVLDRDFFNDYCWTEDCYTAEEVIRAPLQAAEFARQRMIAIRALEPWLERLNVHRVFSAYYTTTTPPSPQTIWGLIRNHLRTTLQQEITLYKQRIDEMARLRKYLVCPASERSGVEKRLDTIIQYMDLPPSIYPEDYTRQGQVVSNETKKKLIELNYHRWRIGQVREARRLTNGANELEESIGSLVLSAGLGLGAPRALPVIFKTLARGADSLARGAGSFVNEMLWYGEIAGGEILGLSRAEKLARFASRIQDSHFMGRFLGGIGLLARSTLGVGDALLTSYSGVKLVELVNGACGDADIDENFANYIDCVSAASEHVSDLLLAATGFKSGNAILKEQRMFSGLRTNPHNPYTARVQQSVQVRSNFFHNTEEAMFRSEFNAPISGIRLRAPPPVPTIIQNDQLAIDFDAYLHESGWIRSRVEQNGTIIYARNLSKEYPTSAELVLYPSGVQSPVSAEGGIMWFDYDVLIPGARRQIHAPIDNFISFVNSTPLVREAPEAIFEEFRRTINHERFHHLFSFYPRILEARARKDSKAFLALIGLDEVIATSHYGELGDMTNARQILKTVKKALRSAELDVARGFTRESIATNLRLELMRQKEPNLISFVRNYYPERFQSANYTIPEEFYRPIAEALADDSIALSRGTLTGDGRILLRLLGRERLLGGSN